MEGKYSVQRICNCPRHPRTAEKAAPASLAAMQKDGTNRKQCDKGSYRIGNKPNRGIRIHDRSLALKLVKYNYTYFTSKNPNQTKQTNNKPQLKPWSLSFNIPPRLLNDNQVRRSVLESWLGYLLIYFTLYIVKFGISDLQDTHRIHFQRWSWRLNEPGTIIKLCFWDMVWLRTCCVVLFDPALKAIFLPHP